MVILGDPVADDPLAQLRHGIGGGGGGPEEGQEGGTALGFGGIVQIRHVHIGGDAHVGIGVALEKFVVAAPGEGFQVDKGHSISSRRAGRSARFSIS